MAEQLDCSEYYCAALFARTHRRHPNVDLPTLIEQVIRAFHAERRGVLACISAILHGCDPPSTGSASLSSVLRKCAHELISHVTSVDGSRRCRFPQKMLQEIDRSLTVNAKLSTSLTNATSTISAAYGQGKLFPKVVFNDLMNVIQVAV
jgi:nuclear pore complex protein Nup205